MRHLPIAIDLSKGGLILVPILPCLILIQNQLSDGCVIQLYLKSSNHYLSITSNGIVQNTANGNDPHSEYPAWLEDEETIVLVSVMFCQTLFGFESLEYC